MRGRKREGGFFRRFFSVFRIIFSIVAIAMGLPPVLAGGDFGSFAMVAFGLANLGHAARDLAAMQGGGGAGPPGIDDAISGLIPALGHAGGGGFFSPALMMAAEAGCDVCSDSRIDLLRVLLGLFQAAEAHAGENDTGRGSGSAGRGGVALGRRVPYSQYITTPGGNVVRIPPGWQGSVVESGQGLRFQRPGAIGNADSIRIMDPTPRYPQGYLVYYNRSGQPLDMFGYAGNPAGRAATHIPLNRYGIYSPPLGA